MKRVAWGCVALVVLLAGCGSSSSPGGESPEPTVSSTNATVSEPTPSPSIAATATVVDTTALAGPPVLLADRGTSTAPVWLSEPFEYTDANRFVDPNSDGVAYYAGARGYIDIVVVASQWGSQFYELRGDTWYYIPFPSGDDLAVGIDLEDGSTLHGAIVDTTLVYADLVLSSRTQVPDGMQAAQWDATQLAPPEAWGDLLKDSSPYRMLNDAMSLRLVDRPAHTWFAASDGVRERGLLVVGPAGLVAAVNSAAPQGVPEAALDLAPHAVTPLMSAYYCPGLWSPVTTISGSADSHWVFNSTLPDGRSIYVAESSSPLSQTVVNHGNSSASFDTLSFDDGKSVTVVRSAGTGGNAVVWGVPTGTPGQWFVWRNDFAASLYHC